MVWYRMGARLSLPAKPYPELARDMLHQGFILGRGRCGNPVSPEKERVYQSARELSAFVATCWRGSADAAEEVGRIGRNDQLISPFRCNFRSHWDRNRSRWNRDSGERT